MKVINSNEGEGITNSLLLYGESKSGKTTQIALLAKQLWERDKLLTRYIQTEGGAGQELENGVRAGYIQHVSLLGEKLPLSSLTYLARGYWPDEEHWPIKNGKVDQKVLPWLQGVGMIALDSLTGAADLLMDSLVSSGRKISSDVVGLYEEEGLKFGAPSMSHYGSVQSQVQGLLRDLLGLPIPMVLLTALESKGEDSLTGQAVLGPAIIGKKLTGSFPAKVRRTIHLEIATKQTKPDGPSSSEYRAYFRPHTDAQLKKSWPADCRLSLEQGRIVAGNAKYANGYVVIEKGGELIEFFDYLETIATTNNNATK